MRLLTRKIYRAFPALDCFSDQQCLVLLQRARGGRIRRTTFAILRVFVAIATTFMLGATISYLARPTPLEVTAFSLFMVGLVLMLGLFYLLAGDGLMQMRLRTILRRVGVCAICRYPLTGLVVTSVRTIRCPECASENTIGTCDDDIVVATDGARRYLPHSTVPSAPTPENVVRTRRRRRKWTWWSLVAILVLPVLLIGIYEWFLHFQSEDAQRSRPTAADYESRMREIQAPQADGAPKSVLVHLHKLWFLSIKRGQAPNGETVSHFGNSVDWTALDRPPEHLDSHHHEYAREIIAGLKSAGYLEELDRVSVANGCVIADPWLATISVQCWTLLNGHRMRLASTADDLDEFVRAFETNLAFVRLLRLQPTLRFQSLSLAIVESTYLAGILALHDHPDPRWIDAIANATQRQRIDVSCGWMARTGTLEARERLADLFATPEGVRFGWKSTAARDLLITYNMLIPENPWIGTFSDLRAELDRACTKIEGSCNVSPKKRGGYFPHDSTAIRLALRVTEQFMALQSFDKQVVWERGFRTAIAIERFRQRHGELPADLNELVPDFLPALPEDPFAGLPMIYERATTVEAGSLGYELRGGGWADIVIVRRPGHGEMPRVKR